MNYSLFWDRNLDFYKAEAMRLLPIGKLSGDEYITLNPTRCDRKLGSFMINIRTGKWIDFATDDKGGNFVSLIAYLTGQNYREVQKWYAESEPIPHYHANRGTKHKHVTDTSSLAIKIWNSSKPLKGSQAKKYLRARGIDCDSVNSMRFSNRLLHSPSGKELPAIVSAITLDSRIVGVHRIYLDQDCKQKSPVAPNKMSLGRISGGAVRLMPAAGDTLAVAEGIETALSVIIATGIPTWAAISSSGMGAIRMPELPGIKRIIIAADADKAGISAADKLAGRLTHRFDVRIALPPKGKDFNDILREV